MRKLASVLLFFFLSLPVFAQIPVAEDIAREFDFWFFDAALGTPETGLTVTSIVCRTVKNGVTTASFNPTASAGSNDMVELGHGGYRLELTAAQLDTAGSFTCACSISGSVSNPVRLTVIPAASYAINYEGNAATAPTNFSAQLIDANGRIQVQPGTGAGQLSMALGVVNANAVSVGPSGSGTAQTARDLGANIDVATSTRMATYTQPTGFLAATFPTTVASTTNITGGTITTVTNLTNMPAIPTNWITAAGINADAFTAAKFASDVSTEFATTLMATTFEGAHTFKHFLQYGAAALFGKYNSSGGTFNFRDLGDTKNRIIYTTTATSRATVTLSPD